jgi:hypothetical protein
VLDSSEFAHVFQPPLHRFYTANIGGVGDALPN